MSVSKQADTVKVTPQTDSDFDWYDVRQWGVEGKGWADTQTYFERLPARAQPMVRPPVWDLSLQTAGLCVRFETDAPKLAARYTLRMPHLAMAHFPATGVSGLDLYARDAQGRWRWVAVGRPEQYPEVEVTLADGLLPGRREYLLYLPLYNGVLDLSIGARANAPFTPLAPRRDKPIVFYGTSIMQGGCASRPGMCHAAILGRRLDRPVINLGFSGNGIMEPEVAALLAELDPALYVIDCLPNMDADGIRERAGHLVRTLRAAHPAVPLVLVEDRTYDNARFLPTNRARNDTSRAALREVYDRLRADGCPGLTYVPGENLLGDDGEATVDGSHPTDVGFVRMAATLEPIIRGLLG